MKKIIISITLISSLVGTTVYADEVPGGILNPLWLPVTILSTLAQVTIPPSIAYERAVSYEPHRFVAYQEPPQTIIYREQRPTVVYQIPQYDRHEHYADRHRSNGYYENRHRGYESQRYSDYR